MKKKDYPGGVKLTLKTARAVAVQEFGTAKGLEKEEVAMPGYSNQPGNLLGQVCPAFGLLWFLIMPLAIWAEDTARFLIWEYERAVYGESGEPPDVEPYSLKSVYSDFIHGR